MWLVHRGGSVGVVCGPIHRVVCGPGLEWASADQGQCFQVIQSTNLRACCNRATFEQKPINTRYIWQWTSNAATGTPSPILALALPFCHTTLHYGRHSIAWQREGHRWTACTDIPIDGVQNTLPPSPSPRPTARVVHTITLPYCCTLALKIAY